MCRTLGFLLCILFAQTTAVRTQPRIVGGTTTSISAFPYQVSIMSNGVHICGGAIIDPNTIITAAHCLRGASVSSLSIRAGSTQRTSGGTVISARSFQRHPRFNPNTLNYDLALIHLSQNLPVSDNIKPIPLYSGKLYGRRTVTATGWGTVREGGSLSDTLRKVSFPIQTRRTCRQRYGSSLLPTQFCAGRLTGGVDTCQGDSGGPLVQNGALVGITSNGNGCGRRGFPGLYTKIPLLRNWIVNNMNN